MMTHKLPPMPVESKPDLEDEELMNEAFDAQIFSRPDGYYWQPSNGRQEFGPFESWDLARADIDLYDEEGLEPGETLQEAEDEIGISDWIDPDTGAPAESQSHPHLEAQRAF